MCLYNPAIHLHSNNDYDFIPLPFTNVFSFCADKKQKPQSKTSHQ